jgi:hypothetical protein
MRAVLQPAQRSLGRSPKASHCTRPASLMAGCACTVRNFSPMHPLLPVPPLGHGPSRWQLRIGPYASFPPDQRGMPRLGGAAAIAWRPTLTRSRISPLLGLVDGIRRNDPLAVAHGAITMRCCKARLINLEFVSRVLVGLRDVVPLNDSKSRLDHE